jgi:hypothetical protein
VLIAAPDTDWSRNIVNAVIDKFTSRHKIRSCQKVQTIEAGYYNNDRYDVGLWCDALSGSGIGIRNTTSKNSTSATFLVNDSAFSLLRYTTMTNRIVAAALHEINESSESKNTNTSSIKLLGLNGG